MDTDKIKDKIRKLLNLGNDSSAMGGEIDNALRFARRLMLQHHVTEDDLEDTKDPHEVAADVEYDKVMMYTMGANLSQWESSLTWAIVGLVGTVQHYKGYRTTRRNDAGLLEYDDSGKRKLGTQINFYGPAEDCQDAKELFTEWSHIIAATARMKYGGVFKGAGRNYAEGFAGALYSKVQDIKKEEKALTNDAGSYALMVVNANEIMNLKKMKGTEWLNKELNIKLTKRSGSRRSGAHYDGDARRDGQRDGQRADFSHSSKKKLNG